MKTLRRITWKTAQEAMKHMDSYGMREIKSAFDEALEIGKKTISLETFINVVDDYIYYAEAEERFNSANALKDMLEKYTI